MKEKKIKLLEYIYLTERLERWQDEARVNGVQKDRKSLCPYNFCKGYTDFIQKQNLQVFMHQVALA